MIPVADILKNSNHTVNLMFNHMNPGRNLTKAKKMGIVLGTNQATSQGITIQTEKILSTGAKTKPNMQLNKVEQEYVYSQLIQQNYENRQGNSVFKSKTVRSTFTNSKNVLNSPPPGLYEPKFIKGYEGESHSKGKTLHTSINQSNN